MWWARNGQQFEYGGNCDRGDRGARKNGLEGRVGGFRPPRALCFTKDGAGGVVVREGSSGTIHLNAEGTGNSGGMGQKEGSGMPR